MLEKKTICMPTHLSESVAEHIAKQAYERGWSNSQYLRWLAILDMKRCEDDFELMSKTSGVSKEHFDLCVPNERDNQNKKTPAEQG